MKMTVIASGSAGNCYILEGRNSALILECGVTPEKLMAGSTLKMSKVAGCLVTHEHGDHAGFVGRYLDLGLQVYASAGTCKALHDGRRIRKIPPMVPFMAGEFKVFPFRALHDAAEPLGFVISHPELGRLLFITDSSRVPFSFADMGLDHIMIEANYSDRILDEAVGDGSLTAERAQRVRHTHMSLDTALNYIAIHESARLRTVTLLHLSSNNADAHAFQEIVQKAVMFADVAVARPGLVVNMQGRIEL